MQNIILSAIEKYLLAHPEFIEQLVAKYLPGLIEGLVEAIVKAVAAHLAKQ